MKLLKNALGWLNLTNLALVIAIVALVVNIWNILENRHNISTSKKNLYYSVYNELVYNDQIIDELMIHKEGLESGNKMFLRDFQFRSYSALLGNMSIRGDLAEKVMYCYQNISYIQNSIKVGRTLPLDRKKFVTDSYKLAFKIIKEKNLKSNLKQSIEGFKNLLSIKR